MLSPLGRRGACQGAAAPHARTLALHAPAAWLLIPCAPALRHTCRRPGKKVRFTANTEVDSQATILAHLRTAHAGTQRAKEHIRLSSATERFVRSNARRAN